MSLTTGNSNKGNIESMRRSVLSAGLHIVGFLLFVTAHAGAADSKMNGNMNPLMDFMFCADPTAVEYDGRLYVYATNDHQQYEAGTEKNSYEKINTLVMLSTDDMVNWTYHGLIDVKTLAPWIIASWAPSAVSRPNSLGQEEFFLYFSNSGYGTGVLKATRPIGPWESPLSRSIVDGDSDFFDECNGPFDPGAVVDDEGIGWLTFGQAQGHIAKLKKNMIEFDGKMTHIPTPYHFEANELNYINGKYVYTYNNDWSDHSPWPYNTSVPTACSMSYVITDTPLDSASWQYKGDYFINPGRQGFDYGNNHTHLHKFQGEYYLFYHTQMLQKELGIEGGYRSVCVDKAKVNESTWTISKVTATRKGVEQIKNLDPFSLQQAETSCATENVNYEQRVIGNMYHTGAKSSSVAYIKVAGADFAQGADSVIFTVNGTGTIEVMLDSRDSTPVATFNTSGRSWKTTGTSVTDGVSGIHDIYFKVTGRVKFDNWQFIGSNTVAVAPVEAEATDVTGLNSGIYTLNGLQVQTPLEKGSIYIIKNRKVLAK